MAEMGYELREFEHGPSPVTRVLRQAAVSLGLANPTSSSISESLVSRADKIEAVFQALISSAEWLAPDQRWEYATIPGGLVGHEQLAMAWEMTTKRDDTPGVQSNCVFYATFLKVALGVVGIEDTELVEVTARDDDLFVTRRLGMNHQNVSGAFRCIDPGVTGNVRRQLGGFAAEARCCFSLHVALRVGDRVYDPTLQASYTRLEDCIDFWVFADPLQDGVWHSRDVQPQRHLTHLPQENAAGFQSAYLLS